MAVNKPALPAAYRLLVGDELGVLRVIEVPAGPKWSDAAMVERWGQSDKQQAACSMSCSTTNMTPGTPALVAIGRRGRHIDVLDAQTGQQVASITTAAPGNATSSQSADQQVQVTAVHFLPATDARPLQLVSATSDGMVSICTCSTSSSSSSSSSNTQGTAWQVDRSFQAGTGVLCMAVDAAGTHIVVGGEGVQPSVWELATGTRVWQGKGSKPNRQTLLVDKPYTTAVAFLPSQGSSAAQPSAAEADDEAEATGIARRFVTGSANAKIQVYDTAAGRRPQSEVVFGGETRVTALTPEPTGTRLWAANGMGSIQVLDLRTNTLLDTLKGAGGSVRALALYPGGEEPFIASAGLDRFLRLHSTETKASAVRVYLKQQLTCVCWLPVKQPTATSEQVAEPASKLGAVEADGDVGNVAVCADIEKQEKVLKKKKQKRQNADHSAELHNGSGRSTSKKRRNRREGS